MQDQLLFLISAPRSGSTLLQRMIGSHSAVATHPEPHLVTPLAYLGYHDTVDKAPYDHINSAEAIRLFVSHLPQGENDYLDALRAYADTLYQRMLDTHPGKHVFMDKTPAYALVLPFLTRLYPAARYVVLTRHPLAVFSSYAQSFFEGRWEDAHAFNPILERYVPAIARLLRERPVPLAHVQYEALVQDPAAHLERVFAYLGLPNEPEAVTYGDRFQGEAKGPGDPMGVGRHDRPVTDSVHKWAAELAEDEGKRALAEAMIERLDDRDLTAWGWEDRDALWAPLADAAAAPGRRRTAPRRKAAPPLNFYRVQRKVFLALRKDIDKRPHGAVLRRIKYYCDVLLRE